MLKELFVYSSLNVSGSIHDEFPRDQRVSVEGRRESRSGEESSATQEQNRGENEDVDFQ